MAESEQDILMAILPRRDASPEQFKRLGNALIQWQDKAFYRDIVFDLDEDDIQSLNAGEPPLPIALQAVAGLRRSCVGQDMSHREVLDQLGPNIGSARLIVVAIPRTEFCNPTTIR